MISLYSCWKDLKDIVSNLENDLSRFFELFTKNRMVASPKNSTYVPWSERTERAES